MLGALLTRTRWNFSHNKGAPDGQRFQLCQGWQRAQLSSAQHGTPWLFPQSKRSGTKAVKNKLPQTVLSTALKHNTTYRRPKTTSHSLNGARVIPSGCSWGEGLDATHIPPTQSRLTGQRLCNHQRQWLFTSTAGRRGSVFPPSSTANRCF